MSQMLKSSGAMGAATLTSRILGMVREMVYANFMGDTPVASAFKLAFQIPNLFRRLLGEGALSAAFIPIFKDKERNASEAEMWRAANAVLSGLVIAAAVIVGVALVGISLALALGAPKPFTGLSTAPLEWSGLDGVSGELMTRGWFSANTVLMLRLLQIMFPYMLLVCVAAVFMGMLNARGHFFIPALSATMLNVVMIASVLLLAPRMGTRLETQIFALAIGVLVAGVAQAGFQLPALFREGFHFQWVTPWNNEVVGQVVRKMVPGMMGVAAFQINVLLTNTLGYCVDQKIVASFDYAVRLMELPQGVFGISLATYLLPALSGLAAEKRYPEFRDTLKQGLGYLLFVNLIASILLTIMAEPIVRLLFERGEFDMFSTRRAALALGCLAPGLIAFSFVNILARAFFALGDTKTPMIISAMCLGLNLLFAFILVVPLRQGGLALANTLSASFNVWLLYYALRRKLPKLELGSIRTHLWGLASSGVLAGIVAWVAHGLWERQVGHAGLPARLGAAFVPLIAATGAYFGAALWLKIPQAKEMLALIRGRLGR